MRAAAAFLLGLAFSVFMVSCAASSPQKKTLLGSDLLIDLGGRPSPLLFARLFRAGSQSAEHFNYMEKSSETSQIAKFLTTENHGNGYSISPIIWKAISASQRMSSLTDGAFDITKRAQVCLQGIKSSACQPGAHILSAAGRYKDLSLKGGRLFARGEWSAGLDLGATAKGAVVDAVFQKALELHVSDIMISFGGSSMAFTGKDLRSLMVSDPLSPQRGSPLGELQLKKGFISTSALHYRGFHAAERSVGRLAFAGGHQAKDKDGRFTVQVTVLAGSALEADGLSTALLLVSPEKGMRILSSLRPAVSALFLLSDHSVRMTSDWKENFFPVSPNLTITLLS